MSDGSMAQILATGEPTGILDRFVRLAAEQTVENLIILSPYWDDDLAAVRQLASELSPRQTTLLLDNNRALFPGTALGNVSGTRVFDIGQFADGRFVHAKLFVVTTPTADHVLFGSANCTVAALGTRQFPGTNEELSLYRKLPPGSAISVLKLNDVLTQSAELAADAIPPMSTSVETEATDNQWVHPGTLECLFDTLIWTRPAGLVGSGANLELLMSDASPFPGTLTRASSESETDVRFHIAGAKNRPAFGRVRFSDGTLSALAIVTLADALRDAARESRGKTAERLLAQLDEETEEGIWLLEVWNSLEQVEESGPSMLSRRPKTAQDDAAIEYPTLSYTEFLAGRVLRTEGYPLGRNSLAGSDLALLRGFLNRALALPVDTPIASEADVDHMRLAFELGDEVSDSHGAVEEGGTFTPGGTAPLRTPTKEELTRRRAVVRQQTRAHIVKAVDALGEGLKVHADAGQLTSVDLLRVRAILTIIAAAGFSEPQSKGGSPLRSRLQVLPAGGTPDSWPPLLGKSIFSLFGGRSPAVGKLKLETLYDQIPDDVMECWSTCMWAIQAAIAASGPESRRFIESLQQRVYELVGLYPQELMNDHVLGVINKMSERFARRLGIDSDGVMAGHRRAVERAAGRAICN
jgi:hypothetical protein